ncbi:MAG: ABC transporter permease [Acidobacteria bacterium]|nr:ABC transporter permease [Acidobacteriota bacterium]
MINATDIINLSLIGSTIRLATPLILAAIGGLYSERAGIINIALEGIMLSGAFTGAAIAAKTGSPWLGLIAALLAGLAVALVHAVACIKYRADQVVIGTAINILFLGVPALFSKAFFGSSGSTPQLEIEQRLPNFLIYIAFLIVPFTYFVLFYTRFGLRLRMVGESPEAADTGGVNVEKMRYMAVLISGLLAAAAGAYLAIGQNSLFTRNMTAGRGYIALAALILGNWHPVKTLLACLFFGLAEAISIRMQGVVDIPNQFIQMVPYILTMIVLAGFIGRVHPPKAIGQPYVKERR